jgi:hypothetical protein
VIQFELNTTKGHPEIASAFEQIFWKILFVKICSKLRACDQVDAEATLLRRREIGSADRCRRRPRDLCTF